MIKANSYLQKDNTPLNLSSNLFGNITDIAMTPNLSCSLREVATALDDNGRSPNDPVGNQDNFEDGPDDDNQSPHRRPFEKDELKSFKAEDDLIKDEFDEGLDSSFIKGNKDQ